MLDSIIGINRSLRYQLDKQIERNEQLVEALSVLYDRMLTHESAENLEIFHSLIIEEA